MAMAFFKRQFLVNKNKTYFRKAGLMLLVLFLLSSMATCGDFELWVDEDEQGGTENSAPTASLTSSPSTIQPCEVTTVTFDGSDSSDSDGDVLFYFWDMTSPEGSLIRA